MSFKGIKIVKIHCFTENSKVHLIVFVLLLSLFSVSSYGQKIISAEDLESSSAILNKSGFDASRLNSLLNDVQPAAYFQNGKMNYYGTTSPEVLYVDFGQFSNISTEINKLSSVELVKVYLKDNNPLVVNQEILNELPNLKYIFFVCDRCGESNMTNMLASRKDLSDKILVIHNSEIEN